MPSPDVIDFAALTAAISGDKPAGAELKEDAALSPLYYAVKDARESARTAERKLQMAWGEESEVAGIEPPDWGKVVKLATDVLKSKSKDLWVASWLTEGLTRLNGFPGMRDGFRLIRELSEKYWDGIHPLPDEDGVKTTVAQLTGLNGEDSEGALIQPINAIPITAGRSGSYSSADYSQALALEQMTDEKAKQKRIARGTPTREMFDASLRESTPGYYRTLMEDLEATIDQYAQLNKLLATKCGKDDWGYDLAPPSSNIDKALADVKERILSLARDKLAQAASAEAAASASAEAAEALDQSATAKTPGAGGVAVPGGTAQQRMETREDAFRILLQVAEFFRRQEPHSILSYGLNRLVRWGRMPLPDLMAELLGEGNTIDGLFQRVGIEKDQSLQIAEPIATPTAPSSNPLGPKPSNPLGPKPAASNPLGPKPSNPLGPKSSNPLGPK